MAPPLLSALVMRFSFLTVASIAMFGAACSSSADLAGSAEFTGGGGGPGSPVDPGANAGAAMPGGGYGATPGGAQDIGVARKMINEGQVPPADALTVEGLVSEHDIPAEGPACTTLMCTRPAWGWAPSFETGKNERWMSIGMTSGITTFVRPALDAVIVIDKSSSMGIDIAQTTEAVARIVDKLRDDDRIAIITYDDAVKVVKTLGPAGDKTALRSQVKAIDASGGANMSGGLVKAFDVARGAGADGQRLRRVMLFSCGYPDTQTRGTTSFVDLVEGGAKDHIGFSFYGILLAFDYNLANAMSQARGGAYAYADSLERIETLFDTDFDFMVTPIAYDLAFSLNLANGVTASRLYGLPADPTGTPKTSFDVKTAFISRRRGAIIARVQGDQGTGTVRLAYEPETAVREEPNADVTAPIVEATGIGVRKAAFLVNEIEGMKQGCTQWQSGKQAEARASLDKLIALLEPEATAMADTALTPELDLVKKLRANMK